MKCSPSFHVKMKWREQEWMNRQTAFFWSKCNVNTIGSANAYGVRLCCRCRWRCRCRCRRYCCNLLPLLCLVPMLLWYCSWWWWCWWWWTKASEWPKDAWYCTLNHPFFDRCIVFFCVTSYLLYCSVKLLFSWFRRFGFSFLLLLTLIDTYIIISIAINQFVCEWS